MPLIHFEFLGEEVSIQHVAGKFYMKILRTPCLDCLLLMATFSNGAPVQTFSCARLAEGVFHDAEKNLLVVIAGLTAQASVPPTSVVGDYQKKYAYFPARPFAPHETIALTAEKKCIFKGHKASVSSEYEQPHGYGCSLTLAIGNFVILQFHHSGKEDLALGRKVQIFQEHVCGCRKVYIPVKDQGMVQSIETAVGVSTESQMGMTASEKEQFKRKLEDFNPYDISPVVLLL